MLDVSAEFLKRWTVELSRNPSPLLLVGLIKKFLHFI